MNLGSEQPHKGDARSERTPQALADQQALVRVCGCQPICDFIELALGFSPRSFPRGAIELRETPVRQDQPGDRMMIRRIGSDALATGIPRVLEAIGPVVRSMTLWELFSPLGELELRRALRLGENEKLWHTFNYTVIDRREFRPHAAAEKAVCLLPDGFQVGPDDMDAFAIVESGKQIAVTSIRSKVPSYVYVGVATAKEHRGRGHGLAVVSATTDWILTQGAVAHYNTHLDNTASLRLARRLGYVLTSELISA
jgi:RimJ/RimL family protein N-acetyltransferase